MLEPILELMREDYRNGNLVSLKKRYRSALFVLSQRPDKRAEVERAIEKLEKIHKENPLIQKVYELLCDEDI